MINVYYTWFLHSCLQFKKSSSELLDSMGESEGEMICENSFETLPCVKQMVSARMINAWSKAPKASAPGQPRGMGYGVGRQMGGGFRMGEHMWTHG